MATHLTFCTKQKKQVGVLIPPGSNTLTVPRGPDPEIKALDILSIFVLSTDPAFVPAEIAERLEVTTEGARHQMNKLVENGLLAKKKPGKRTVLYWVTEDGIEYYAEHADAR